MGLGLCTTSIGDEARQTCCSYFYQPAGAKSRMCVQNCPPPFFASFNSLTGDCSEKSKSVAAEYYTVILNHCMYDNKF